MKRNFLIGVALWSVFIVGCAPTRLVITEDIADKYPEYIPEALKIDKLKNAKFQLLLDMPSYRLIRADIPWSFDRVFIIKNNEVKGEYTSLEGALANFEAKRLIAKESLPYSLRELNAQHYQLLCEQRGCKLVRAIKSWSFDNVYIVKGNARVIKEYSTGSLNQAWSFFKDYVKQVDYIVRITDAKAEVKTEAGDEYKTIAQVEKGEGLKLLDEKDSWRKVKLKDGREGWINRKFTTEGELKLEEGKLMLSEVYWTLYDKDKLIPAFSHLYGREGYKGIKEIGVDPSIADNLLEKAIKTGDKTLIGIAILSEILEGSRKKGEESTYNFSRVILENQGDLPINCLVEVGVPDYALASKEALRLEGGQKKTIELTPKFKDSLFEITEQRPWQVYIKVIDTEGRSLLEKTQDILILSRNDMIWTLKSAFDTAPLIATFVTPRDKMGYIDKVLRLAADRTPFKAMGGYIPFDDSMFPHQIVEAQMEAIYDTLANLGIRYVNAPISYAGHQRIKFPSQVLDDKSGNCIELSLLSASLFEAMEMEPIIVLVPGHAFVGVRAWQGSKDILFLETTQTGTKPYSSARKTGEEEFYENNIMGPALIIDIGNCRKLGITPVPGISLRSKDISN